MLLPYTMHYLKALRKKRRLSQLIIGEALGKTQNAVSFWEKEMRGFTIENVAAYTEVLNHFIPLSSTEQGDLIGYYLKDVLTPLRRVFNPEV